MKNIEHLKIRDCILKEDESDTYDGYLEGDLNKLHKLIREVHYKYLVENDEFNNLVNSILKEGRHNLHRIILDLLYMVVERNCTPGVKKEVFAIALLVLKENTYQEWLPEKDVDVEWAVGGFMICLFSIIMSLNTPKLLSIDEFSYDMLYKEITETKEVTFDNNLYADQKNLSIFLSDTLLIVLGGINKC